MTTMLRRVGLVLIALAATSCGGSSSTTATHAAVTHPSSPTTARPACPSSHESSITDAQLPPDTKAEVEKVRAAWAHKYPTAVDAVKAGWRKSTPSLYGIGAHYIKDVTGLLSVAQPFDALHPNILLYDGEGPDAKFAGVSYVAAGKPKGFAGCYDVWHSHPSVCIDNKRRVTLTELGSRFWYSESQCRAAGFHVLKIAADNMIHVWIGPGYTDAPIFAHDNPKLYDGYYPKGRV
jgi:hypothetical protein